MRKLSCLLLFLMTLSLHSQIRFEVDFNTEETGSEPAWVTPFDGRIFFSATDGYTGREAWVYDPAINQAYRLGDINPSAGDANPREVTVVDGVLYFVADTPEGRELWQLLPHENQAKKIETDTVFNEIKSLTVYANALYFRARYQGDSTGEVHLHRYQFTEAIVERVANTNDALALAPSFDAMCVHNDQLFLLGRRLEEPLQTLITYDATTDSFAFVDNQLTENDLPIWVTDFRSFGDYLMMNIRDPENLNDAFLGVYETATDSITIELEEALWGSNQPIRSIEVAGEQFFFRKKGISQASVRSYDPSTRTVGTIPGLADNEKVEHLEVDEEVLILITSVSYNDFRIRSYDPSTGLLTGLPFEESFTGPFNGRTFNVFARLGNGLYYQGGSEDNAELFRFQEPDETITRLTDIHPGTGTGTPRFLQKGVDNKIYTRAIPERTIRAEPRWVQYDPAIQSFETLLPELEWSFYSKLYQFPGYLVATLVTYEGVNYEAVAFDSTSLTYVPIIEAMPACNGSFTRAGGTYIPYDGALYFTYCDGDRLQLYRHQFSVPGAAAVSQLTEGSLHKGSFTDETIGKLGNDLIIPLGASFNSVFRSDLYRYDGDTLTEIDLQAFRIREPSVVQTPNAVYLSVNQSETGNYYPAYLREGDPDLHFIIYEGDTIPRLFPLNFHLKDTTVYFIYQNQVLRHTPNTEAAELYYDLPDELSNAYAPYLFNGRLYFVATESNFGSELYEVSNLNEAPVRVSDISIGRPGSRINSFQDNGERLFFAADDGFRGSELWSYQPDCFTIHLAAETSNINWPTGSIFATPNSGTAPFSYRWNTGATTASIGDLETGFYEVTITDASGCSASQNSWVETNGIISSTEEEDINFIATAYPNPFTNSLSVQFDKAFPGEITADLFALSGQLIRSQHFSASPNITLEVTNLPAGFFVLRLRDQAGRVIFLRKVIKK